MTFLGARWWLSKGHSGGASITSSYNRPNVGSVRRLEKTCECPIKHVLNWRRVMTWETWSRTLFGVLFPIPCKHGRRFVGSKFRIGYIRSLGHQSNDPCRIGHEHCHVSREKGGHMAVLEGSVTPPNG